MDFERPHHHRTPANNNNSNSNSASSELFICFSSRLSSSSSMKLSSKSILSPGRTDKQISLSASLSRRLRSNGSIKGGQSPMFPTGTKKRGCAFENTEPTSPKVTCIGQVRVKTKKKQAMKMRSMSKRRGSSGEASFRRIGEGQEEKNQQQQQQQHSVLMLQRQQSQNHHLQQEGLPQRNNQKWVHLPLTICEALRAFGAEFNCFLPCRSSCMSSSSSSDRESKEKMGGGSMDEREAAASARSCGAVFARWLVAMQEGEAEKGREIELVVGGGGGGEEEEDTERRRSHHRRHVMEDIDINEVERCNNEEKFGVMEEQEGSRVSICVPPKNALLLMRCRSDPVKMAALANRFWESPVTKDEEDDAREEEQKPEGKEIEEEGYVEGGLETEHNMKDEKFEDLVALHEEKEEASLVMKEEEEDEEEFQEINLPPEEHADKPEEEEDEEEEWVEVMEGDELVSDSSIKALVDPENHEIKENKAEFLQKEEEEEDENRASLQSSCSVVSVQSVDGKTHEIEAGPEDSVEEEEEEEAEKSKSEEETTVRLSEEETTVTMTSQRLEPETHEDEDDLERESRHHHANLERESSVLPDCLLLMMCEPKLSMEVSKETWVCSTDFIRCIPSSEKKVNKTNGRDHHPPKKKSTTTTTDSNPPPHNILLQPPRSSISLPVVVASQKLSMATMIEQKLVSSVAYEPFVLTRCKSEPMRTAAVKLKPEACFWNNRKLEPHHRGAAVGVGAAGVGF